MAYVEYDPETFQCLADGCHREVVVFDQRTLHWYNNHGGGERPKGHEFCDECLATLGGLSVECLNRAYVVGDSGCLGDGSIYLVDEYGERAARWYLINRPRRPKVEDFCTVCKRGIVYEAACRNVGCRGDGRLRYTGKGKQDILFVARQQIQPSEAGWPPRQCLACREFMGQLQDQPTQCMCCQRHWVFTAGRQRMLVRNEPRERFKISELCDLCSVLTNEERQQVRRQALIERRQTETRRKLESEVSRRTGIARLEKVHRDTLQRTAARFFRAPDPQAIEKTIKRRALQLTGEIGGEPLVNKLDMALFAKNVDAGVLARAIANPQLEEVQRYRLVEALGRLADGQEFPPALMQRIKVRGGLRMTTGMAGTGSARIELAQAAAYEVYASAAIIENPEFPIHFLKRDIASYHYRFQHNRIFSASETSTFEGDIVVQKRSPEGMLEQTLIDFKHTMRQEKQFRWPEVHDDQLARIETGLRRGIIDRAIFVSNRTLSDVSLERIARVNRRLAQHNSEEGDDIPLIETFVRPWRWPDHD